MVKLLSMSHIKLSTLHHTTHVCVCACIYIGMYVCYVYYIYCMYLCVHIDLKHQGLPATLDNLMMV